MSARYGKIRTLEGILSPQEVQADTFGACRGESMRYAQPELKEGYDGESRWRRSCPSTRATEPKMALTASSSCSAAAVRRGWRENPYVETTATETFGRVTWEKIAGYLSASGLPGSHLSSQKAVEVPLTTVARVMER
jgi:hypothetical protein